MAKDERETLIACIEKLEAPDKELGDTVAVCLEIMQQDYALSSKKAELLFRQVWIYVYPIDIASLYFPKRLNIVATGLIVAGVSVGQIPAFYLETLQDDDFMELDDVIIFGVVPRALVKFLTAATQENRAGTEQLAKIVE